ncbi:uncharacterized protein G2W53_029257 [Senna tora]|uniref:Uncharacterized protein n=1 Tax=Senna tora TaxID=362788 RepID=A0A834T2N4_9FABA|nr:uncharacterized protein G2W53_029257 [Senna tora]
MEVPRKQRGDGSQIREYNEEGIVLACSWKKNLSTRRKVFAIFQQSESNQKLLCSMVTEDDQDSLAMLRSIRLFLEDYGRDQMGTVIFNIPSKNIINQLNHRTNARIRLQTILSDIFNILQITERCARFCTPNSPSTTANWAYVAYA